jgi:phosphoglycerate dehydrogenase-like enzyme
LCVLCAKQRPFETGESVRTPPEARSVVFVHCVKTCNDLRETLLSGCRFSTSIRCAYAGNTLPPNQQDPRMESLKIAIWQPAAARRKFQLDASLDALGRDHVVWLNPKEESDPTLVEITPVLGEVDAIVAGWGCGPLPAALYAAAPHLRLAALIGSSVKPLSPQSAWARGITITNTARAIAEGVAEYVLGAMLLWLHKYDHYDWRMKRGEAWAVVKNAYRQRNLCDLTIGLVGCGLVGGILGTHLRALGAEVAAFDPYVPEEVLVERGIKCVASLEGLMRCSDIVSIHAGATSETNRMIGARELAWMQNGTLLVNSARGAVLDEGALLHELRRGRIDAFLDVFQEEPLPESHPFRSLPNVHLAPHAASSSNLTVLRRAGEQTCANLRRLASGEPLEDVVTPEMFERMT